MNRKRKTVLQRLSEYRFPMRGSASAAWTAFFSALMLTFCVPIFAQAGVDQGSITGTVKDPSGALVVGATCTLTNTATGVSQSAITTSAGAYTFPFVQIGTYSLKVTKAGFKDYNLKGIVVHLGTTITEDVAMQVGAANVQVTVTSAAPLLQAQDASLGMTVTNAMATELPLFGGSGGRNFMNLTTVAPGVQFTGSNLSTGTFLINGVQSGQVDVRLNGADDNSEVFGGITIPPIPDAIQEMKVQSGNNSATMGEFYGTVVNVETKAGTNKFQGTVWEYNENDMFDANDYFNKLHQLVTNSVHTPNRPGRYKENSFGGVFGGPVILPHYNGHNKTFFTVDFQRTDYTQSNQFTSTVPTLNMQNSGFTNLSDIFDLNYQTVAANAGKSEKTDGEGRSFQVGTILDPATTRAIPCGTVDPITGLTANCASSENGIINTSSSNTNPNVNGSVPSAIIRDPYFGNAPAGCPSLMGTTNWNSTINQGPVAASCLNQIPQARLDPNAVALLSLFPHPNQQNASSLTYSNNYYAAVPQPTNTTQYDIRIDDTLSNKDSLFGTFSHYLQTSQGAMPLPGILEGGASTGNFQSNNPAFIVVVSETHVFSPSLINEFRFSRERNKSLRQDPDSIDNTGGIPAQYGIAGIPQAGADGLGNGGLPDFIGMSGLSAFGSRSNITNSATGAWEYSDDLTKIRGKHELKFGGEWLWTYGNIAQLPASRGSFSYSGVYSDVPYSGDSNTALADFLVTPVASTIGAAGLSTSTNLIGGVNGYSGNNFNLSTYHAPYLAFYGVDNWKITPSFTANLGIRYSYFGPYYSTDGQEANLWMGGYGNTANGTAFYVAHDGCATTMSPFFRGLLAYDNIPIICQPNNAANETPKANWAPRLGFAYRVRPDLVLRAGAGMAYGGFGSVGYGGTLGTNYPFRFTVQNTGANNAYTPQLIGTNTATMENIFGLIDLTNPVNATTPVGSIALYGKQYHFKEPYVITLTTAVQWQFTNHDSIQATYVGNIGQDLESADPYNNAPSELLTPSTTTVTICATASNPYCATGYVPFPNLNALTGPMETTEQVSNYQSGQLEYQHQFAYGFNMDANYTFARCWSDTQGGQQNSGGPANGRAPWVTGYRYDYDRCQNTAANVFKMSGEFDLPFGKGAQWASNANAWEDAIIGGWKIDPVWIASSGTLQNLNCFGTNGYGANPNFDGPWFDTNKTAFACFAPTEPGQHLYGPGPKDLPRTKITGFWNSSAWTAPQYAVQTNGQSDWSPLGVRGDQVYGPGWYDVDFSIHKQFNTGEGTKLEIQAQALNAFNHVQLNAPPSGTNASANYTNPSGESLTGGFGTITGDRLGNGEGRIIQLVGKFYF